VLEGALVAGHDHERGGIEVLVSAIRPCYQIVFVSSLIKAAECYVVVSSRQGGWTGLQLIDHRREEIS
jgi:hypothetical protein